MSVIDCDYLPADKAMFPPALVLQKIKDGKRLGDSLRRAGADLLTKDARRALAQGVQPRHNREMRL